jgi:hypothetical protein
MAFTLVRIIISMPTIGLISTNGE